MNTKLEETFNMSHELPKEETENNPIEEEIINLNKYKYEKRNINYYTILSVRA